jgi:hypothetical protein
MEAAIGPLKLRYDDFGEPTDLDRIGKERLKALYQELFGKWPEGDIEQMLFEMDCDTLRFWSTVTLGHTNLDGKVTDRGLEFIDEGRVLFTTKAPPSLQSGWAGKLDVDIVVDASELGLFGFISSEKRLVDTWQLSSADVPEHLKSANIHNRSRTDTMQLSQEAITAVMEDEAIKISWDHGRDELERLIERIYPFRAIPDRSDEDFEEIISLMQSDGILPLLGNDLRLLADAAAASLCAPVDHNLDSISSFHMWTQEDPYSAVNEINFRLRKHFRLPVFAVSHRRLLGSLI